MNKKLIAIAVAAGLAAPMAASADVTVYGKAHVSVDSLDDGQDSGLNVSDNASRVGFKGSEDLGGGLKANFKYELAVDIDAGNHGGGRNHHVGLSGGFGEIRIGYEDSPLKNVRSKTDLFGDMVGDLRNFSRNDPNAGGNNFDERFRNNIHYLTPKLGGGAVIEAMYSTNWADTVNIDNTASQDTDALSLGATFKAGPVTVMLAHESHNFNNGTDESAIRASVKGTFAGTDLRLFYQSASDIGGTSGDDRDVIALGAAWKFGKNTLKLQYAMADDLNGTTATGADMLAVGIDHALSKKTKVYVAYAATDNDTNASYSASGGGGHEDDAGVDSAGKDPSAISLGIVHDF